MSEQTNKQTLINFEQSNFEQLNLAQWLTEELQQSITSLKFDATQQMFSYTTSTNLTKGDNKTPQSTLELIVFSQLPVTTFALLLTEAQLTLRQFSACNHRNNLTSFRFYVSTDNLTEARKTLIRLSHSYQFDAALIKDAPQLSVAGLLVMDMDSTTIKIECIDEIAALAGVGEEVAQVTESAMQGELDFSQSLHQRVAKLTNAPETILAQVANTLPLMDGLENLVTLLKEHNWRIAIASGGFTYFADHLKELLALDAAFANTLEIKNHQLTGKVLGNVVDANVKAQCIEKLQQQFNIDKTQTVAMGDGANDLVMMAAAHLGVAFRAKPIVLEQADTSISYYGLDCLLHWLA